MMYQNEQTIILKSIGCHLAAPQYSFWRIWKTYYCTILENERVMPVDYAYQTSTSLSSTTTTNRLTIPYHKEVRKNTINSFTSRPISGRFRRVAEIVDERKRLNPKERYPPLKRKKSKLIVPRLDKFAKDKKVQQKYGNVTPIQQAMIRFTVDILTSL